MFDQEERAESVDLEGGERMFIGYAARGFFWMQNPRDAKGKSQRCVGEARFAVRGGRGDCILVCAMVC